LLCRRLVDLGGDWLWRESAESAIAEELIFEGDRLAGVKLLRSENEYRASQFIIATDAGAVRRLIPEKKHHRKLTAQLDWVETREYLFTVNWVLPRQALPKAMGDLLLLESDDADLGPVLLQTQGVRRANGKEDEALCTVSAGAFIAQSTRDLGEEHLHKVVAQIEAQLEKLMPFSRKHLLLSSAPYLHAGGVRGSRLLPHPLLEVIPDSTLGIGCLPLRTSVKNLFLASREVLPGLGLEGEVLAGLRAASTVQWAVHKSDPLRRASGRG
jgi:hypothetical protein